MTPIQWVICAVAALGFAFDIYELLMLPLIVRPALLELAEVRPGTPEFSQWVGFLFFLPAVCGGVFGLLGGYLTDRLGRRRVLVWSILLYGFSACAAGFVTSPVWLLVFRCTTFVGVCVEFVAAVAWLAELFPNPKQREAVLGYTQAFGSIGGLMVTGAYYIAVTYAESLPAIHGVHEAWRYTLISGVIPAIPLMLIRPFLPESPLWAKKKEAGTLRRPSLAELFRPEFRTTTIITTLMFACSYGAAFGAIQHVPRIVPGLAELSGMARTAMQQTVSVVQGFQEIGGLLGADRAGDSGGSHSCPAQAAEDLSDSGAGDPADRVLLRFDQQSNAAELGHPGGGVADGRAIQFLGELSSACLSDSPAGDGRKFRGEYRRPHDRDLGCAGDDDAPKLHARGQCSRAVGLRGGAGRVSLLRGGVRG